MSGTGQKLQDSHYRKEQGRTGSAEQDRTGITRHHKTKKDRTGTWQERHGTGITVKDRTDT